MAARPARPPARRPGRAGVSVETREMVDGTERFYARHTDPRGKRLVVKSPDGRSSWADWGEALTAACVAQVEAERLSYRSRDGERLLFRDLVRDHYLPSLRDASPNTRQNTASHLGDGSGVPTRHSHRGPGRPHPAVVRVRSPPDRRDRPERSPALDQPDERRWVRDLHPAGQAVAATHGPTDRGRPGLAGAERRQRNPAPTSGREARRGPGHHPRGMGSDQTAAVRGRRPAAVRLRAGLRVTVRGGDCAAADGCPGGRRAQRQPRLDPAGHHLAGSAPPSVGPRSAGLQRSTTCGTGWCPGRTTLAPPPLSCSAMPATPARTRPRATCMSSTRSSGPNGSPP